MGLFNKKKGSTSSKPTAAPKKSAPAKKPTPVRRGSPGATNARNNQRSSADNGRNNNYGKRAIGSNRRGGGRINDIPNRNGPNKGGRGRVSYANRNAQRDSARKKNGKFSKDEKSRKTPPKT